MYKLYDYQKNIVDQISKNCFRNEYRQLVQLPTGAGKTVVFCGMTHRYISKIDKKILILVHREELLKQTKKTMFNGFEILCETITAKKRKIDTSAQVYVGMVETIYNRFKRNPKYLNDVGMVIIDECHLGNFRKIYDFFPNTFIIGFSATPVSAKKTHPLKGDFSTIIQGVQISELMKRGKLSQNITYAIQGVDSSSFKVSRGDFETKAMSNEYSNVRNIKNTIIAYEKYAKNTKTIIFNVDVAHSQLVTQAFLEAGYNAKHLDGKSKNREELLIWFKNTPDAILCNVGVATTGFDEPTINCVIVNRSTMSMPLWLQMAGRGGRVAPDKNTFIILDMGGNAKRHGDWSFDRDWRHVFDYPEKASKGDGVAMIKECNECEALIPVQAIVCEFCGCVHERKVHYDSLPPKFTVITNNINVHKIHNTTQKLNHKEWKTFFVILKQVQRSIDNYSTLSDDDKALVFSTFESKIKEWLHMSKKRYTSHIKKFTLTQFNKAVNEDIAV